jgi:SpoVK/Ycf46/Vps4 family AAA+-type ATPase
VSTTIDRHTSIAAFARELEFQLRSGVALVHLRSSDEARALGALGDVAKRLGLGVTLFRPEAARDARAELDEALTSWATQRSVLVLVDVHGLLDDPVRVRRLRTAARRALDGGSTIVLLTPDVDISASFGELVVLDVPGPDRDELRALAEFVIGSGRVDIERLSMAAIGLSAPDARRAFERVRIEVKEGLAPANAEQLVIAQKERLVSRTAAAVEFVRDRISVADVGGLDELKLWLDERRKAFAPEARAYGLPAPRGLLLLGVQGCGKSLAARAVAGHWGLPLLRLDLGALFSGEASPDLQLRRALDAAESVAPCVLWVDEVEKGFDEQTGGTATRMLGTLLTWLQERVAPVFFVATANKVEALPPELFRRGRLDEVFFVDLPDRASRVAVLDVHLRRRGRDPQRFNLGEIADASEHFSGAELEQVIVAALHVGYSRGREVEQHDLLGEARKLVPLYALYEAEIKALRAWAQGRARHAGRERKLVEYFQAQRPQS